jgi:hypothetical protein
VHPSDRPPLPYNANEIAEISRFGGASPTNFVLAASINDGEFYLLVGKLTEPFDVPERRKSHPVERSAGCRVLCRHHWGF